MDWGNIAKGAIETGVNALTGGMASGIGSLFSSLFGGNSEKSNRKFQEQMLDKQLNFQSDQAQLNRDFQAGEADKMRQYNSIVSQVQRAQAAGVNPWSLVSSGGQVGTAQNSSPSGSMPSGSASIPSPVQANQLVHAQSFNAVADALNAAANARRAGLESDRYNEIIDKQLAKMDTEISSEELRQVWQGFANQKFEKTFQYQVSQEFEKWQLLLEQTNLTRNDANKALAQFREVISKAKLNEKQEEYMRIMVDNLQDMIDSKLAVQASETGRNIAHTGLLGEQTRSVKLGNWYSEATIPWSIRGTKAENQFAVGSVNTKINILKAQLEIALKTGDWFEVNQIIGSLEGLGQAVGNFMQIKNTKNGQQVTLSDGQEVKEFHYNPQGKLSHTSTYRTGSSQTSK